MGNELRTSQGTGLRTYQISATYGVRYCTDRSLLFDTTLLEPLGGTVRTGTPCWYVTWNHVAPIWHPFRPGLSRSRKSAQREGRRQLLVATLYAL